MYLLKIIGLNADEVAAARQIFDAVDQDGSGKIDADELKIAMSQAGRDISDDEVIMIIFFC